MERRRLDHNARDLHGFELGERHQVSCAAHVPANSLEHRGGRHWRELPGNRRARLAPSNPEHTPQPEIVDLHDDTVDLVLERVAPLLPAATRGDDLLDIRVQLNVGVHPEAVLAQPLERGVVRLELDPLCRAHAVAPDGQRTRRGDVGIELADRAGGGVAGVRERRLAASDPLLIYAHELVPRHVGLAAHLDQRRRIGYAQRDRSDRLEVGGHVLAGLAVSAGSAAYQHTVLVDERDREPVDLRLGYEPQLFDLDTLAPQNP
ncbi:hypothetical protein HRbin41_00939 [bacterium HR41]|nr:hypothetical protein HRbin41_00939 [bacterium HR41]